MCVCPFACSSCALRVQRPDSEAHMLGRQWVALPLIARELVVEFIREDNRYSDAYMLWRQWAAMPLIVRELVVEYMAFEDRRFCLVLGDNEGIIPHVYPLCNGVAERCRYDWHFGWLLERGRLPIEDDN